MYWYLEVNVSYLHCDHKDQMWWTCGHDQFEYWKEICWKRSSCQQRALSNLVLNLEAIVIATSLVWIRWTLCQYKLWLILYLSFVLEDQINLHWYSLNGWIFTVGEYLVEQRLSNFILYLRYLFIFKFSSILIICARLIFTDIMKAPCNITITSQCS